MLNFKSGEDDYVTDLAAHFAIAQIFYRLFSDVIYAGKIMFIATVCVAVAYSLG